MHENCSGLLAIATAIAEEEEVRGLDLGLKKTWIFFFFQILSNVTCRDIATVVRRKVMCVCKCANVCVSENQLALLSNQFVTWCAHLERLLSQSCLFHLLQLCSFVV